MLPYKSVNASVTFCIRDDIDAVSFSVILVKEP